MLHPFVLNPDGTSATVCGPSGWKLYAYKLQFVSVSPAYVPIGVEQTV